MILRIGIDFSDIIVSMKKDQPVTKQDLINLEGSTKQEFKALRAEFMAELAKSNDNVLFAINNLMTYVVAEFEKNHKEHQKIFGYIDSLSKDYERLDDEQVMAGRQIDRHDRWIHEIADKSDHKLTV